MISWPYIPCFPDRNALEISTVSLYLFLYLSLWLPCSSNISMANCFHQLLSLPSDSRFNFIDSPRVSVQTHTLQHIPPLVSHSMCSITFSVFYPLKNSFFSVMYPFVNFVNCKHSYIWLYIHNYCNKQPSLTTWNNPKSPILRLLSTFLSSNILKNSSLRSQHSLAYIAQIFKDSSQSW